ncbi:MAG: DNA internalization-related competence protein ComEC/Rec2 [Gammaproteobacteria bacterium]|jgi:competence protein ComEC
MIAGLLCLFAGILAALSLPVMPSPTAGVLLLLIALSLMRLRAARPVSWALAGCALVVLEAGARLADRIPASLVDRDWRLDGEVVALLSDRPERPSFLFHPDASGRTAAIPGRIRLVWYDPPAIPSPGERWRLVVRLREPRGTANPHGFDYERWLLLRGIGATGYVRTSVRNQRIGAAGNVVDKVRSRIADTLRHHVGDDDAARLLEALITGNRAGISQQTRDRLMATGTAHLLAISGLHVGIAAATGAGVAGVLARAVSSLTRFPFTHARGLGAAAGACAYACLAGLSIATHRALVMVLIIAFSAALERHAYLSRSLILAAWVILVTQPLAPLDGGFWLSFGAVTILCIRFAGRLGRPRRLGALISAQAALTVGMIVPALSLFGFVSTSGFMVNLVAVPLVATVVLPSGLLGALATLVEPLLAGPPLKIATLGLDGLLFIVEKAERLGPGMLRAGLAPLPFLLSAALASLILVGGRGIPGCPAAPVVLLAILLWKSQAPPHGGADMTVLDVGQGLSVVVRTHGHVMVYDAGPAWRGGDAGARIVLPYLRGQGLSTVDTLVISHGDADHAGGAAALLDSVSGRILAGPGTVLPDTRSESCRAGDGWTWDGVRFEILHPPPGYRGSDNNASCVLRIQSRGGVVLLPGDIENALERALVRDGTDLAADVVVAPHHGSATSSSRPFVSATDPDWVVFASGYRNRWRFPRNDVVERWTSVGAKRADTARGGAVMFAFRPGHAGVQVTAWRCLSRRFWRYRECDRNRSR